MNIASIDIGSNSVILLIADVNLLHKRFVPVLNQYTTPRVSKGLSAGNPFPKDSIVRLNSVLKDFVKKAHEYNSEIILPAATQAFRKATDAEEVSERIKNELGLEIRILSGYEEGLLTFYGAIADMEDFSGYMIDIGGGSTEVFFGRPDAVLFSNSYNFGAVSTTEQLHSIPPVGPDKIDLISKYVKETIVNALSLPVHNQPGIAVAGTPTTLACMQLGVSDFDENKIEGYELSRENIIYLCKKMAEMTPNEIVECYGAIIEGREDVILSGGVILATIMEMIGLENIIVSARGLRHGVIYNYLHNLI